MKQQKTLDEIILHQDRYVQRASNLLANAEKQRESSRLWLHVDLDAFFAAVALRSWPELQQHPVAIGDMSCITTCNYEARKFGVRSAMPGFNGRSLCPQLTFLPLSFPCYEQASLECQDSFQILDAEADAMSLDEAYLDVTTVADASTDLWGVFASAVTISSDAEDHCEDCQRARLVLETFSIADRSTHAALVDKWRASIHPILCHSSTPMPQSIQNLIDSLDRASEHPPQFPLYPIGDANSSRFQKSEQAITLQVSDHGLQMSRCNFHSVGLSSSLSINHLAHCASDSERNAVILSELLRLLIALRTMLTCSIGIGANRMLAKIASDENKPFGIYLVLGHSQSGSTAELAASQQRGFMHALPLKRIPGIGESTMLTLQPLGINLCGHVWDLSDSNQCDAVSRRLLDLQSLLTPVQFQHLLHRSMGIASAHHESAQHAKAVGNETTFQPVDDRDTLLQFIDTLSAKVSDRLKSKKLKCRTVTLKMRSEDWLITSRQQRLSELTDDAQKLADCAKSILSAEITRLPQRKFRLLGVRATQLQTQSEAPKWARAKPSSPSVQDLMETSESIPSRDSGSDSDIEIVGVIRALKPSTPSGPIDRGPMDRFLRRKRQLQT